MNIKKLKMKLWKNINYNIAVVCIVSIFFGLITLALIQKSKTVKSEINNVSIQKLVENANLYNYSEENVKNLFGKPYNIGIEGDKKCVIKIYNYRYKNNNLLIWIENKKVSHWSYF